MCLWWQPSHIVWEKICTHLLVHIFRAHCFGRKRCKGVSRMNCYKDPFTVSWWDLLKHDDQFALRIFKKCVSQNALGDVYATGRNTHKTGCRSLPRLQKRSFVCFKANICLQLMFYLVCKISFAKDVLPGCKMCTVCIDELMTPSIQGSCKAVWVEFAKDRHSCWRSAFLLDISIPSK